MSAFLRGLRAQFLAGSGVAALFAAVVCGLVIYLASQNLVDLNKLEAVNQRHDLAEELSVLVYKKATYMQRYVFLGDRERLVRWEAATAEMDKTLERLLGITQQEEDRVQVRQIMEANRAYDQFVRKRVLLPVQAGDREAALEALRLQGKPLFEAMVQFTQDYMDKIDNEANQLRHRLLVRVRPARARALGFTAAGLVVSAVLSLWLANRVARPVGALVSAATAAAAGDLTRVVELRRADEIGALAEAFNTMIRQLRELVGRVAATATELAAQSQQLAATSQEVTASAQTMAAAASQLSAGAEEAAASTRQAAASSGQVERQASQQVKAVEVATDRIRQAAEAVYRSGEVMRQLGERSARIGDITETITGIADQTNLLALNAAIEAARAGEHGRGFAVVAEEVRKLAEGSLRAAREIGELVGVIQQETAAAVAAVEQSTTAVRDGVGAVEGTSEQLRQILGHVAAVLASIEDIARVAEQSSQSSQQVAGAAQDISNAVQQVSALSQELAKRAEGLTAAAQAFRLA